MRRRSVRRAGACCSVALALALGAPALGYWALSSAYAGNSASSPAASSEQPPAAGQSAADPAPSASPSAGDPPDAAPDLLAPVTPDLPPLPSAPVVALPDAGPSPSPAMPPAPVRPSAPPVEPWPLPVDGEAAAQLADVVTATGELLLADDAVAEVLEHAEPPHPVVFADGTVLSLGLAVAGEQGPSVVSPGMRLP